MEELHSPVSAQIVCIAEGEKQKGSGNKDCICKGLICVILISA